MNEFIFTSDRQMNIYLCTVKLKGYEERHIIICNVYTYFIIQLNSEIWNVRY